MRLVGWRYSPGRGAWVHRAFRGRFGPVYTDAADDLPGIAETVATGAMDGQQNTSDILLHMTPTPPPERPSDDHPRDFRQPAPAPPTVDEPDPPEIARVEVRLSEAEEPRLVKVDGRPPRLKVTPPATETAADGVAAESGGTSG